MHSIRLGQSGKPVRMPLIQVAHMIPHRAHHILVSQRPNRATPLFGTTGPWDLWCQLGLGEANLCFRCMDPCPMFLDLYQCIEHPVQAKKGVSATFTWAAGPGCGVPKILSWPSCLEGSKTPL